MLASSVVGRGFESRLGQTKDYKIDICFFSAKSAVYTRDWLGQNEYNVSKWSHMLAHGMFVIAVDKHYVNPC